MQSQSQALSPDLEFLSAFLLASGNDDCMLMSELDGFLTGVAVGPELIAPSQWLPAVWGSQEPVFENEAEAQLIIGAMMAHYNDILNQVASGAPSPIFLETVAFDIIPYDWAEGFMAAIRLNPRAWAPIFKSDKTLSSIAIIVGLCCDEAGQPLMDLPDEILEAIDIQAEDLIPGAITDIDRFWRRHTRQAAQWLAKSRPGRNQVCPCGSGQKYKKCCGAS